MPTVWSSSLTPKLAALFIWMESDILLAQDHTAAYFIVICFLKGVGFLKP